MTRVKPRTAVAAIGGTLAGVAGWDLWQRRHTILRNYPIIGHLRFILEAVGPELRQYIVTDNNAEKPFSRDQRRWVYTSPAQDVSPGALGKRVGDEFRRAERRRDHRAKQGAALAGALHSTGEGGVSPYHLNGADLIWQIGTGYFGCRDDDGSFSLPRLVDRVAETPSIRAIEIKLSQGAKPGLGGMLPGAKVTPEIAAIRGVPVGVDCKSPAAHAAFHDVDGLLDLVETIASATGLPVGIKSAVGEVSFWPELAARMADTGRGIDFVTVDGGEGGTGAAPLVFSDHVALPFKWAFPRVYAAFAEQDLHQELVFIGSAKLGSPLPRACGRVHPALVPLEAIELLDADRQSVRVDELFGYKPGWGIPGPEDVEAISALMG